MVPSGLDTGLQEADPKIAAELSRQRGALEMIALEKFALVAVHETQGSVLTNRYAERYPGRRYYGGCSGCEHLDVVEKRAIDRVKTLFGAGYVNVRMQSGAQLNAAVIDEQDLSALGARVGAVVAAFPLHPGLA